MCFNQFYKLIKQITAIMRAGCGFRMVLHGEGRFAFNMDTFNALVVQVHMGNLDMIRFFHRFRIYTKAVVLGSDL